MEVFERCHVGEELDPSLTTVVEKEKGFGFLK